MKGIYIIGVIAIANIGFGAIALIVAGFRAIG